MELKLTRLSKGMDLGERKNLNCFSAMALNWGEVVGENEKAGIC